MIGKHHNDPGVVIILGMHRSGTSCLTGSLQQAGLYLGRVNEAATHNAKGNRENRSIRDLNDEVLLANRGRWDRPPDTVTWHPAHHVRRDSLIASYPSDRTWGFKDPRTLLTLDGWLQALPQARLVGTFRHPLAVSQSLQSRDKLSVERGLELWLSYNRRLLDYRRRFGFDLICFDWSPDRYHARLRQMADRLSLSSPGGGFSFFDSAFRRNRGSPRHPLPGPVSQLHDALCEAAD